MNVNDLLQPLKVEITWGDFAFQLVDPPVEKALQIQKIIGDDHKTLDTISSEAAYRMKLACVRECVKDPNLASEPDDTINNFIKNTGGYGSELTTTCVQLVFGGYKINPTKRKKTGKASMK